jgi:hypothetical protein
MIPYTGTDNTKCWYSHYKRLVLAVPNVGIGLVLRNHVTASSKSACLRSYLRILKSAATSATSATLPHYQAVTRGRKVADVAEKPSINT